MSIYSAMLAGVSGLTANSSAMAVVADNIANVNTTAYKNKRSDFSDMVNAQSSRTTYNAGGVNVHTRQLVSSQGNISSSTSTTDLAIQGNGFFVVTPSTDVTSSDPEILFTRVGTFYPDDEGYLVNSNGYALEGWKLDPDGKVIGSTASTRAMSPINVNAIADTASASTTVALTGNLDSDTEVSAAAQAAADGTAGAYDATSNNMASGDVTPDAVWPFTVVDSLGGNRTINMALLKSANANEWHAEVYVDPADQVNSPNGVITSGTLAFTTSGQIDTTKTSPQLLSALNIDWKDSKGIEDQTIQLQLGQTNSSNGAVTQYALDTTLTSTSTDGTAASKVESLAIDEEGYITATFTSGAKKTLYQIPIVTFINPDGLKEYSGGAYQVTQQSGDPTIQMAGKGSAGTIESSALESSKVDLAAEFSNMIMTQRAYSASSKIITTADDMLDELINMKR